MSLKRIIMPMLLVLSLAFINVGYAEQEWLPGFIDKEGRLGQDEKSWRLGFINTLCIEGATSDNFETCITGVDPTADNSLFFPNISGILITNSGGEAMFDTTLVDGILNGVTNMQGELDINDGIINDVGYVMFNTTDGIPCEEGKMFWNDEDGTNNLGLKGSVVCLQLGQEMLVRGKNTTGGSIANGTAVRISGVNGNFPLWGMSNAADPATAGSIGLTTEIIGNNSFGYVTTFGLVRELDTTGTPVGEVWSDGDRIYVGNTSGELTNIAPTGSERKIFIGIVFNANANEGIIWVNPINVSYFNELSGPLLTSGSVVFINASGMTVEDNDNFFWDDTNDELIVKDFGREAEMHGDDITTTLDGAGTFANIVGLENKLVSASGMIQNATDGSVTVSNAGRYKFIASLSISDETTPSEEFHFMVGVNGAFVDKCEQHRSISVQSSLGSVSVTCMLDLADDDIVTMMANSLNGDDLFSEHLNWMIFK